ncbi:MAG: hypothetical protein ACRBG0_04695 [Lewinella sp.]|uniref:hypothetical protein n=1 Tax=Lewinella sp. TaxID=2004506 RepID=UPI003D6A7BF8
MRIFILVVGCWFGGDITTEVQPTPNRGSEDVHFGLMVCWLLVVGCWLLVVGDITTKVQPTPNRGKDTYWWRSKL